MPGARVAVALAAMVVTAMLPLQAAARSRATGSRTAQARRMHREGARHFEQGRLRAAIAAFERGYRLSPRPEFLLNLAQCYRGLGLRQRAIAYLQRFVRQAPRHRLRPAAEHTLAELRKAGPAPPRRSSPAASLPSPSAPAGNRTASTEPAARPENVQLYAWPEELLPPPRSPRRRQRHRSKHWRWILIGAGVAAVIGAVAAGAYIATRDDDTVHDLGTLRLPPP